VKRRAGKGFTFEALPERELKGFGEPVTFYRATRR
jgi:class 3 adenylate cyclase